MKQREEATREQPWRSVIQLSTAFRNSADGGSASTMEGREQPSDSAAEATWDPFLGTEKYSWAVALQLELGLDVGVQHPPRWLAQT